MKGNLDIYEGSGPKFAPLVLAAVLLGISLANGVTASRALAQGSEPTEVSSGSVPGGTLGATSDSELWRAGEGGLHRRIIRNIIPPWPRRPPST